MTDYKDKHIIELLKASDGKPVVIELQDNNKLVVWNIAWGYDMEDEYAHITTNVSPEINGTQIDFFYSYEIERISDQKSKAVIFENENNMNTYIDGFVFPLHKMELENYKNVALKVAEIWKEYGALSYQEYVGDDLKLEGTRSFAEAVEVKADEVIVFGWVVFPSKEVRDEANKKVPLDPRMEEILAPINQDDKVVFDASRMFYGGFKALLEA